MTNGEDTLNRVASILEGLATAQGNLHQQTMEQLQAMTHIAEQQAQTATQQQQSLQVLAVSVGSLARSVEELSRTVRESVEASRRAAQAAESAAIVAQDNQNAIRDLIEEMRRDRT